MLYLFILRMSYSIKRGMKEAGWDYNKSDIPKSGIIKTPTRKISAQKIPTWSIHSQIFKYSHMGFLNCFVFYCHRYHWYYLKDCFVILCFKSAEVRNSEGDVSKKIIAGWPKRLHIQIQERFYWTSMTIGHCYNSPVWF